VGTTPGGVDIVSPMSDVVTGYRRIPKMGNCQMNLGWRLDTLPEGTYYWSVQAIDQSFMGGAWAEEQVLEMEEIYVDFTVDNNVCADQTVTFADISIGNIESWHWSFGDGGQSSNQNPEYFYAEYGSYDVTLTVVYNGNSYSQTKTISILPGPEVNFSFDVVPLGQVTTFTNLTEDNGTSIVRWLWDFDDGNTYNGPDPQYYKFQAEGNYNVKLFADAENGCVDSISKVVTVCKEVLPKPQLYAQGPNVYYLACSNDSASHYRWYRYDELINGANDYHYIANKSYGSYRVEISSDGLCFIPSDEVNIGATGIDDAGPFANLKIYPNPTPGVFTIEMDNGLYGELVTRIFNAPAAEILNIKFDKNSRHFKAQVDLSGQGKGVYIVSFVLDKYRAERKLVVE
jgi:PKD repeat protein